MPVHLYGQVADMDAILAIARAATACWSSRMRARRTAPSISRRTAAGGGPARSARPAAFSFYPGKNLGACGEAGAVTTDDEQVAQTIRMLREHGQAQKYLPRPRGLQRPSRRDPGGVPADQAAAPRPWNAQRRAAAGRYNELLAPLARAGAIMLPAEPE